MTADRILDLARRRGGAGGGVRRGVGGEAGAVRDGLE